MQKQQHHHQQGPASGHGHALAPGAAVAPPGARAPGSASPSALSEGALDAGSTAAPASVSFASLPAWPQTHLLQHLQQQQQQQQQQGQAVDGQLQAHVYLQHALHLAQRAIQTQQTKSAAGRPGDNLKLQEYMQLQSAMSAAGLNPNDRDRALVHQLSRNEGKPQQSAGIVQQGSSFQAQGNQSQQRVPNNMSFLFGGLGQNSQPLHGSPIQSRSVEPNTRNQQQQYIPPEILPQLQARMLAMQKAAESPHLRLGPQTVVSSAVSEPESVSSGGFSIHGNGMASGPSIQTDLLSNIRPSFGGGPTVTGLRHSSPQPAEGQAERMLGTNRQQHPSESVLSTLSMASKPDMNNLQGNLQLASRQQQQLQSISNQISQQGSVGISTASQQLTQQPSTVQPNMVQHPQHITIVPSTSLQINAGAAAIDPSLSQHLPKTFGFTRQQLMVLRAQILAFRRLKRGDRSFTIDMIRAITPVPLTLNQTGGMPVNPASSDNGSQQNQPKMLAASQEAEDEKLQRDSSMKPQDISDGVDPGRKGTADHQVSPHNEISKNLTNANQDVAMKAIVITEEEKKSDSGEISSNDPLNQLANGGTTTSLSLLNARIQTKNQVSRRFRGPLFDFLPHSKKPEAGTLPTNTANVWGPPVSLGYAVGELLLQEGVRIIDKKKTKKLKVIEMLLSDDTLHVSPELKLKLRIEQRKLILLEMQGRIRNEIEEHQQEIMAMGERAYRKFVRLCERQRVDLARQVMVLQKTTKEKYLKGVFQWRKKLLEAHWSARDARINRNRGVAKFHEKLLREFSKRKDEDRSKRMEALKNNDVDAYREMLIKQQKEIPGDAEQRFQVLSSFLTQTEDYLHKLGGKISAVKNQQESEEAALAAAAAARARGLSEEEIERAAAEAGDAIAARSWNYIDHNTAGSSVNKYYSLAHAVNEQIIRQPSMLRAGILRDYQLVGLQWMLSLYNNRLNGILADEMGLGKTVQVMALIAYLMEFKGNYGPHLIIVPNAVIVNWKSELLRWLPSVNCIFYVGVREERSRIYSQDVSALKFNVLVTTYEFIMRDRSKLAKVDWKYIIIDEAQRMKDRESRLARDLDRFRCQRRLLLTGTPLQNDLHELWSLLNLLLPEVFDNSKAFHDWFSKPFQKDVNQLPEDDWLETEKKVIVIHRLHQILEPFMLRRRVEDVEGSLPPKVAVVMKCKMSAYQAAIYDWVRATGTIRLDPADEEERIAGGNSKRQIRAYAPLQNKCMELRKVCNHPFLNYPPQCRLFNENVVRMCGKLWVLDRILIKLQKTGHRVLLFSTMTKLLDILEDYLQWRGLIYRRIDGTTPLDSRESAIVDFNAPRSQCFIFLLSIRAAGRGLNLQTADTVVIYDPDPNPKNEEQAVARAHRIGQKSEVKVIYMEAVVETITSYQKEDELRNGGSLDVDTEMAGKDRYMGSVESLVRNNIQQHKIDMADEVINAGRFDQRTTHEERRTTLETLLHDEERYQETVHDVPTMKEVNRMISRTEEEVELFDQMDEDCEWPGDMIGYDEVPEWLHVGSDEVEGAIKATSKQSLMKGISGISGIVGTKAEEDRLLAKKAISRKAYPVVSGRKAIKHSKRGRPPYEVQKVSPIEIEEIEDLEEAVAEEETSSGEEEEEGEIREGSEEDEEAEVKIGIDQANDGQGRDIADDADELDEEVDVAAESSEEREESPETQPEVHLPDSKKFGSLAALGSRSQQELAEDLEEGEIAASADSRADSPPSENWVHEQEGDEDQVVEPRRKRKRSMRHRRKPGMGNTPLQGVLPVGYVQPTAWPGYTGAGQYDRSEIWGITPRPGALIHPALASWASQTALKQNRGNGFQEQADDLNELRETRTRGGARMQDNVQKKCKAVLSKLQGAMNRDGRQVSALLMELPRHNEYPDYYKVIDKPIDAKTIEEHLDHFDYATVLDFAADVQLMLDNASRYNTNNAEVQADARRLHSLFFQRMGLMFPDVDFDSIKINIGVPVRLSGSRSSRKQRQVFAEAGRLALGSNPQDEARGREDEAQGSKDKQESVKVKEKKRPERIKVVDKAGERTQQARVDGEVVHPADLVICKKKRNSRKKVRPPKVPNKRKRGAQLGQHTVDGRKDKDKDVKSVIGAGGPLSWAWARNAVNIAASDGGLDKSEASTPAAAPPRKKSRTDSGRRRPPARS